MIGKFMGDERLSFRVDAWTKKIIKAAADISNMTISEFVINAADEKATQLINEKISLNECVRIQNEFGDYMKGNK